MDIKKLLNEIKKKKEYSDLADEFVLKVIKDVLDFDKINLENKKEFKDAVKKSRKHLREIYSAFKTHKYHKKEKILEEINYLNDIENHEKILKLHKSTKERLPYYREIYEQISKHVPDEFDLLDLGCGFNPFSLPFMNFKIKKYYAVDVTKADMDFIEKYFKKIKIDYECLDIDLTNFKKLPSADVCFMFKLLDTLETIKKNISKELLNLIDCKILIVSFPKISLGGRKKISTRRLIWFEKLIKDYEYNIFEVENERFYVINKQ